MRIYVHLAVALQVGSYRAFLSSSNAKQGSRDFKERKFCLKYVSHITLYSVYTSTQKTSHVICTEFTTKITLLPISLQSKFQFKFSQTIHPALTQGKGNYGCQERGMLVLR
jgi:hypothetical protein